MIVVNLIAQETMISAGCIVSTTWVIINGSLAVPGRLDGKFVGLAARHEASIATGIGSMVALGIVEP